MPRAGVLALSTTFQQPTNAVLVTGGTYGEPLRKTCRSRRRVLVTSLDILAGGDVLERFMGRPDRIDRPERLIISHHDRTDQRLAPGRPHVLQWYVLRESATGRRGSV